MIRQVLLAVDGDCGYSDLTVLPSGGIAVFYERDGYSVNEVAVVTLFEDN